MLRSRSLLRQSSTSAPVSAMLPGRRVWPQCRNAGVMQSRYAGWRGANCLSFSTTSPARSRGPSTTTGSGPSVSVTAWRGNSDRRWRDAGALVNGAAGKRGFRSSAPMAAAAGDDGGNNDDEKKGEEAYREETDDDDDDDNDGDDEDFSEAEGDELMPPKDMPLHMMVKTVSTPEKVLVVPVIKTSIMPGTMGRATVRDPEFLKELQELRQKHPSPYIGLFIVKDTEEAKKKGVQITTLDQVHQTGVLGVLTNVVPIRQSQQKDGVVGVIQFLSVHKRIKIDETVSGTKRLVAKVTELQDKPYDPKDPQIRSFQAELEAVVHRIGSKGDVFARDNAAQLLLNFWTFHNPLNAAESADFVAGIITHIALDDAAMQAQQDVIEELDVTERLKKTLSLTKRELSLSDLTQKIKEDINQKMEERHRQMMLRDELKAIRTELGLEQPQTETLMAKFKERIQDKKVPEHAAKVINEEMEKFQHLSPSSTEYNVVRTYLDWLTTLPWDTLTKDNLDMLHAEKVLEDEHYGLKDVKERILEFIAVGALKGEVTGKIICLVGPPGVGKTSIGKSIANALQREFFRFSVGGMTDEAEIKGHRRTYVGAMPGKLLQALKRVKTSNPVVLLDEVDKIGTSSYKGDPSSALLEVLDPSQNAKFLDHYLDVSYDLSKVLFICTANVLHTIPRPLLDRMEVIRLSGYVEEEKVAIAEKYLVPKAVSEAGLAEIHVNFQRDALRKLIHSYAREAGVRNLQQQIDKIMRKVAHQVVLEQEKSGSDHDVSSQDVVDKKKKTKPRKPGKVGLRQSSGQERAEESALQVGSGEAIELEKDDQGAIVIQPTSLGQFLGKPPFSNDRYYDITPPGVVMGLAWTSMGGSTPYIETVVDKHQLLLRKEEKAKRKESKEKEQETKVGDEPRVDSINDKRDEDEDREEGGGGSGRLITTGQMGEVMQESCSIAYTCAKIFWNHLGQAHKQRTTSTSASTSTSSSASSTKRTRSEAQQDEFDEAFFRDVTLHMHLPEGATPKDGPSAGIGMVSSLLSLALGKALRQDMAMTGEITLTGKVLPVGGIKEKVIAARRAGVRTVVFPEGNKKDWDELEPYLREGLEAHFVDYYGDVFRVVFPDAPKEYQRALSRKASA